MNLFQRKPEIQALPVKGGSAGLTGVLKQIPPFAVEWSALCPSEARLKLFCRFTLCRERRKSCRYSARPILRR